MPQCAIFLISAIPLGTEGIHSVPKLHSKISSNCSFFHLPQGKVKRERCEAVTRTRDSEWVA
jgi:hypothetical protein